LSTCFFIFFAPFAVISPLFVYNAIEDIHMKIDNTRVKNALRKKGITLSELARRIGTDRSNIYHYLRGDYDPKIEKVEAIAETLDVSVAYLAGMTDDPAPTGDPGLDSFLDNFIRSTQPGSFGAITVTEDDLQILAAFHEADPLIQSAVRRLLDLEEAKS
jgi:transcriptional regulator with XRE-family HTH domain